MALLLLWKINVLDIFDMCDFFQIFFISRTTDIIIAANFRFGVYVQYILKPFKKKLIITSIKISLIL